MSAKRPLRIFYLLLVSLVIVGRWGTFSEVTSAEILFRPTPGLNDGTDDGSLNAGKDAYAWSCGGVYSGSDIVIGGYPRSNCNGCNIKGYIQFNIDSLPASIYRVYLGLTHYEQTSTCWSNCAADFYFFPVAEAWNEMTVGSGAMPAEGSEVYGPISLSVPNNLGFQEYDITDTYVKWKNATIQNNGLTIYSPDVGCNNGSVGFFVHSSDDPNPNTRPYLRIIYKSPLSTGNIIDTDKYAWSETSGWANFRPDKAGVTVYPDHLEGYAWGENIGWIKLGSYSGGGTHTYGNTTKDDWGVIMADGNLSGYGWSETSGWVNFGAANGNMHFDKLAGALTGYAWAENVGWIHFDSASPAYSVKTIQHAITLSPSTNGGISCVSAAPDGWNVTCSITPLSEYYILSLSDNGGNVNNPAGSFQITGIDQNHTLSATFAEYMIQRIDSVGANYEKSLPDAYENVKTNGERILLKHYGTFIPMDFNQSKKVSIEGGYQAGFSRVAGQTSAIPGSITVTDGTVATDGIAIQQ
ncbi:MAG: DNRLRE domain-containing protein [Thermodesulfovibrionales bacterium]